MEQGPVKYVIGVLVSGVGNAHLYSTSDKMSVLNKVGFWGVHIGTRGREGGREGRGGGGGGGREGGRDKRIG